MDLRFSRHARNRLRNLNLEPGDIEDLVASGPPVDRDPDGRKRYEGYIGGSIVRVVLAVDRQGFVVTVHRRRK